MQALMVDKGELIDFLLQQPLVIEHENALLLHAGVPPNWDKNTLLSQSFMLTPFGRFQINL
jgi:bis(5'-nucleosyl)-tetraphosphatase (symmetrical)